MVHLNRSEERKGLIDQIRRRSADNEPWRRRSRHPSQQAGHKEMGRKQHM